MWLAGGATEVEAQVGVARRAEEIAITQADAVGLKMRHGVGQVERRYIDPREVGRFVGGFQFYAGKVGERGGDEVAVGPEHVSTYELTFEPETPFGRALARGRMQICDEDLAADLIDHARTGLLYRVGRPGSIEACVNLLQSDPQLRRQLDVNAAAEVNSAIVASGFSNRRSNPSMTSVML